MNVYLRPTGFIESPQQHEGSSARLAGGMLWFTQVEVIDKTGAAPIRKLVDMRGWDAFVVGLSADKQARCNLLYSRMISSRSHLTMRERTIRLDQPQVMGIMNMTPDSFSNDGKNADIEAAAAAAIAMSSAGAAIIDIGGESTRPGAPLIWEGDEIKRVEPLIQRLASAGTAVSIDSRKAAVMEAAILAGAAMINDVSALLFDDRSIETAKTTGVPVVLMHAPSQSSDPHKGGDYSDVVTDVFDWLEERVDVVEAAGIARDKILVDPGIGFGKSLTNNLDIINNLAIFHAIGCPILFGGSRKRMIGALSNEATVDERLGGSVFLAMKAVEQGAHIVRVHDVPETVQAIHVWRGLRDAALTGAA